MDGLVAHLSRADEGMCPTLPASRVTWRGGARFWFPLSGNLPPLRVVLHRRRVLRRAPFFSRPWGQGRRSRPSMDGRLSDCIIVIVSPARAVWRSLYHVCLYVLFVLYILTGLKNQPNTTVCLFDQSSRDLLFPLG